MAAKMELYINYEAPMFVYIQRQGERPFNLNAKIIQLSAEGITFKCRTKIKKGEIVGVIFKVNKKDIMVNLRVISQKRIGSGLRAEFSGTFIGLNIEQENYIRKFVLYENLKINRKRRIQRQREKSE